MKTIVRQKLSLSLVFLPIVSPLKLSSSLVGCNCLFEKVFWLVFETKLMIACEQVWGNCFRKFFPPLDYGSAAKKISRNSHM